MAPYTISKSNLEHMLRFNLALTSFLSGLTHNLLNQAYAVWFDPMLEKDAEKLRRGFDAMLDVCSNNGGMQFCRCATGSKNMVRNLTSSVAETFFCLPKKCRCRNGKEEEIPLWVLNSVTLRRHKKKSLYRPASNAMDK